MTCRIPTSLALSLPRICLRRLLAALLLLAMLGGGWLPSSVCAQDTASSLTPLAPLSPDGPAPAPTLEELKASVPADMNADMTSFLGGGPERWTSPEGLTSALQIMLLMTVLTMAPAVLLMTTSFVRIVVVFGLLRQALGAQSLPPSQVITSLALFMTLAIMTPVWSDVYTDAIGPYSRREMSLETAWKRAEAPIRSFMSRQIEAAGNSDDVWLFYEYMPEGTPEPESYDDVPLRILLPAYMLSELKVAFLIGFQVYLPFLILDIVVSSITISMGMMMLPPGMISLPLKIMLFVLVDGWTLMVSMLLESFVPYTGGG
ncbi:flagellar type III secretion system pore protein FliP [Lignipirellula cremea]|uniref:Flagellar biosynthetic protein FliP n=1 Tax=Lignipirellula cremea TaxID=2528010 RepID=A0A518E0H8_9BACT|nr:flagellar type III secretion system pore protein FliP [Lignipirellula cremea]QDU97598.1 Flagellar biosynthetic protein FliP precursor [Lignipirellula cremea]